MRDVEVGPCWGGHPLKYALHTTETHQFVAYYNEVGFLTVAQRRINSETFEHWTLDQKVGWDSHCGIEMMRDNQGIIHLCANMHGSPLVYYRSQWPDDVTSLERQPGMIDATYEGRCTYPKFIRAECGDLMFMYRHGSCGNGTWVVNRWEDGMWWRVTLVFAGEGKRSAYPVYRDGHFVYVWREGRDCATNHSLCYVSTADFCNWYGPRGEPVNLPITLDQSKVIDDVPIGGGLLNGNTKIGYDKEGKLVVSYHKYIEDGTIQIFNARLLMSGWEIVQASDWAIKWDFGGEGTIHKKVIVHPVDGVIQGKTVLDDNLVAVAHLDRYVPERPQWRLKWEKRMANRDQPQEKMDATLRVIFA
ncbi:MAG: BNR repeat-containing protein [Planctomycetota bacterium]